MDYIKWRGDLTLKQAPFNEVDNLILAFIAYVNFSGIVPEHKWNKYANVRENPAVPTIMMLERAEDKLKETEKGEEANSSVNQKIEIEYGKVTGLDSERTADRGRTFITVKEASKQFWELYTEKEVKTKTPFTKMAAFVLQEMAESRRFGELQLSHFINEVDEDSQKQFSAMQIRLDENLYYLAYRGTDETIVGWMEDFNMVYLPEIPSERRAIEYMEEVMQSGNFYHVGGHSKGGHLALYASVKSPAWCRKQILSVTNHDGPGVNEEMAKSDEYLQILEKMVSYVPEQSLFGLMLEHKEQIYTVKSNKVGPLQHDALSWEIMGPSFVKAESVTRQSQNVSISLKNWLLMFDVEEREKMIRTIFNCLAEVNIRTVGDLVTINPIKIYDGVRNLKGLDAEEKELLSRALRSLIKELNRKKE